MCQEQWSSDKYQWRGGVPPRAGRENGSESELAVSLFPAGKVLSSHLSLLCVLVLVVNH